MSKEQGVRRVHTNTEHVSVNNSVEISWTSFLKDDEILKQELENYNRVFEKYSAEGSVDIHLDANVDKVPATDKAYKICHNPDCYFNSAKKSSLNNMAISCPGCGCVSYHSELCVRQDAKHFGVCSQSKMKWKLGVVTTKSTVQSTSRYLSVKEIEIDWNKNLGSGGYSLVYAAKCRGAKYAAKVIDKQMVRDKNIARVIAREVEVHSKLDHPHIIKLQYIAESESCLVILTELASNGNLSGKSVCSHRVCVCQRLFA